MKRLEFSSVEMKDSPISDFYECKAAKILLFHNNGSRFYVMDESLKINSFELDLTNKKVKNPKAFEFCKNVKENWNETGVYKNYVVTEKTFYCDDYIALIHNADEITKDYEFGDWNKLFYSY